VPRDGQGDSSRHGGRAREIGKAIALTRNAREGATLRERAALYAERENERRRETVTRPRLV